jgi:hypothetical protein
MSAFRAVIGCYGELLQGNDVARSLTGIGLGLFDEWVI